jgi:cell division protein FtsB
MREWRVGGRPPFPPGLILAILVPACVFILLQTAQRALEGYQMTRQVEVVRREVAELRQQNLELQGRIARQRSDAAVERVAREELNLVKPGDVPVIIVAPTPAPTPPRAVRPTPTPDVPIARQWLRLFVDEP